MSMTDHRVKFTLASPYPRYPKRGIIQYDEHVYVWINEIGTAGGVVDTQEEAEAQMKRYAKTLESKYEALQAAAQIVLDNLPFQHQCWEDLQDAVDEGKDADDCIKAWLRAIVKGKPEW